MKSRNFILFVFCVCCSFAMFGRVVRYEYDESGNMVSRHLTVEPMQQKVIENSSVKENTIIDQIKVYPNPVGDILNVEVNNSVLENAIQIGIFSMSGNQLETLENITNITTIDFSDYTAGVYLLVIESGGKHHTYKIIKK